MKSPSEFEKFTQLVDRIIAVPRAIIKQRIEDHRKQVGKSPRKRGPKRKTKPSAARALSDQH